MKLSMFLTRVMVIGAASFLAVSFGYADGDGVNTATGPVLVESAVIVGNASSGDSVATVNFLIALTNAVEATTTVGSTGITPPPMPSPPPIEGEEPIPTGPPIPLDEDGIPILPTSPPFPTEDAPVPVDGNGNPIFVPFPLPIPSSGPSVPGPGEPNPGPLDPPEMPLPDVDPNDTPSPPPVEEIPPLGVPPEPEPAVITAVPTVPTLEAIIVSTSFASLAVDGEGNPLGPVDSEEVEEAIDIAEELENEPEDTTDPNDSLGEGCDDLEDENCIETDGPLDPIPDPGPLVTNPEEDATPIDSLIETDEEAVEETASVPGPDEEEAIDPNDSLGEGQGEEDVDVDGSEEIIINLADDNDAPPPDSLISVEEEMKEAAGIK